MKSKTLSIIFAFAAICCININKAFGQEGTTDTLYKALDELRADINALKKIKISGYVQAQFQLADSTGQSSFAGGDFPTNSDKRFAVRRGRIKFAYTGNITQYVLQFDVSEGGLSTKDAYLVVTEPWLSSFSLTAGIFNRPFGYEIAYSSNMRESPERSRFTQTLFPGERESGAMFTFQPPKTSRFNFIKINAGMFNGNGIAADFDKQKDFIGQISISRSNKSESIKYGLGFSYYNGGYYNASKYVYSINNKVFTVDSASTNKGNQTKREYFGVDGQIAVSWPVGMTQVRAEYVWGQQPGEKASTKSRSSSTLPTTDTYIRNFNGYYVYLTQNIGQTKHQLVLKYDSYDPNTDVEGKDITSKLSKADIKYNTIGLGWIYKWDANVKFMVYYDIVKNEETALAGYVNDLRDNVLTCRVQYKF